MKKFVRYSRYVKKITQKEMKKINKIVRQETLSKENREWIKQIRLIMKSIRFDLRHNIDYMKKTNGLKYLWDRKSMRDIILKNLLESYRDY